MLGPDNEASSAPARVDVPGTPAAKAPSLRLGMGSRQTATPSLKLHGPKPPVQQRPDPITDSLLELVAPSPPVLPLSQLPDSLDSMPPPDFPASKRRSIAPGAEIQTFSQILASESLSLLQRSQSPCSRPSQSGFGARMRAAMATRSDSPLDSQYDSQATHDDEEDREERRRDLEALRERQRRRSDQQKKDKEPARTTAKTKLSKPPTVQKDPTVQQDAVEIDSHSAQRRRGANYIVQAQRGVVLRGRKDRI